MRTPLPTLAGAVLLAAATLAGARAAGDDADVAKYTFRSAPINSMGIKGLDDLRGKPVLVEFWGTR